MAGMLDVLPFANRSSSTRPTLYDQFVAAPGGFSVVHTFWRQFDGRMSGSAKNDAYRWAITNLLLNSTFGTLANPIVQGYMIDYFW